MHTKQATQQNEMDWSFPHVGGNNNTPYRRPQGLIDTYTASYMRWQSKAHVLAWLQSFTHPLALQPVFLDTETTGTRRFSEVIEVCIVNEQGQTLYYSLVNPTTEIEPLATAVHGLTRRHVKNAPRYPEIHEEVMRLLCNHVVITYNASFDMRILRQTANCYQLAFPAFHTGCLMYAYARYREVYLEQRNGQRRYKLHRLDEAIAYEKLDPVPFHRAERDAQCAYYLFCAMIQNQ